MATEVSCVNHTSNAFRLSPLTSARWHPIVASNRGPIEHNMRSDGTLTATRASGGVVTALSALERYIDYTWVAAAATDGDRQAAASLVAQGSENPRLSFVSLAPDVYHRHYALFSNPLLWFLQHNMMPHLSEEVIRQAVTAGWTLGYLPANAAFAAVIAGEARRLGRAPVVLLQDYHLYMTAWYVRRMLPEALLQHFTHIPWPKPGLWLILPSEIRLAIFRSMLANDIVGFQTARDARHFLEGVVAFLPEAAVDHFRSEVVCAGHRTLARTYPISIDLAEMGQTLSSAAVRGHRLRLQALCGERTIVRVDRLDPTKDVATGFRAFDRFLERNPRWVGRVKFLAFLVPTRSGIDEYRHYAEETFAIVSAINSKYGRPGYQPVELFYENNRPQALAALKLYDALLVNPTADGMNLVAKEGPIANERDGVLVLSEGAGAHEELRQGVLSVTPGDVAGIADALEKALDMPMAERGRRASFLRRAIMDHDLEHWLTSQLQDLRDVTKVAAVSALMRDANTRESYVYR